MHNLLRCRRGSVAFATVVALVPLIGVVALGAEAGSWYVTKQHAQNAADAAAIRAAWRLACSIMHRQSDQLCTDTNSVDYRGKQFAAQNTFCNTGDTSYPGSPVSLLFRPGTSQIGQHRLSWPADQVRATVSQQQPAYLAKVLGLSTVNIAATASCPSSNVDETVCLGFNGFHQFSGQSNRIFPNIAASRRTVPPPNAIDFTGNGGLNINAPSFTAGGCSQTGGSQCNKRNQPMRQPVPNPLSGLDSAMSSLKTSDFSGGTCSVTMPTSRIT